MRFFAVLFFICFTTLTFAQTVKDTIVKVSATVKDDNSLKTLQNVHIINFNTVKGTITNEKGFFEIDARVNDTLHISILGYQSIRVKVTNDWVKSKSTEIKLTEKAYALEEVIVTPYNLTGYLEIDAKIIQIPENYRYGISGLPYGYEAGKTSPNAISRVVGSLFNPADLLYNFFGNFSYKGFDAVINFNGVSGNKIYDNTANSNFYKNKLAKSVNTTAAAIAETKESVNNAKIK